MTNLRQALRDCTAISKTEANTYKRELPRSVLLVDYRRIQIDTIQPVVMLPSLIMLIRHDNYDAAKVHSSIVPTTSLKNMHTASSQVKTAAAIIRTEALNCALSKEPSLVQAPAGFYFDKYMICEDGVISKKPTKQTTQSLMPLHLVDDVPRRLSFRIFTQDLRSWKHTQPAQKVASLS